MSYIPPPSAPQRIASHIPAGFPETLDEDRPWGVGPSSDIASSLTPARASIPSALSMELKAGSVDNSESTFAVKQTFDSANSIPTTPHTSDNPGGLQKATPGTATPQAVPTQPVPLPQTRPGSLREEPSVPRPIASFSYRRLSKVEQLMEKHLSVGRSHATSFLEHYVPSSYVAKKQLQYNESDSAENNMLSSEPSETPTRSAIQSQTSRGSYSSGSISQDSITLDLDHFKALNIHEKSMSADCLPVLAASVPTTDSEGQWTKISDSEYEFTPEKAFLAAALEEPEPKQYPGSQPVAYSLNTYMRASNVPAKPNSSLAHRLKAGLPGGLPRQGSPGSVSLLSMQLKRSTSVSRDVGSIPASCPR